MMRALLSPPFAMRMPALNHVLPALALLGALGAAQAADKARESSFGQARSGSPILTRAQLRECLGLQQRVAVQGDASAKEQATLDAEKAEIARLSEALEAELATLDRTSAEAVAAHNEKAQAHSLRIDAYNARTPAFNARVAAVQADRDAFVKNCGNRRYDEDDEIAIKRGK